MASTSCQQVVLDIGNRGFIADISQEDQVPSEICLETRDSCTGGNGEMLHGCNETVLSNVESLEPSVGMEFKSLEVARAFYEMYALRIGFTIRNGHIRRSHKDHSIIGREFVCTKEGFRAKKYLNMEKRVLPPRPITREGCNATLRVSKKGDEKWVISGFVKDHTHELSPSRLPSPQVPSNAFFEDEKDRRIRELSEELQHEKRLRAACQRRLSSILKEVEEHTQNLTLKVEAIVNHVRELESEEQANSHHS